MGGMQVYKCLHKKAETINDYSVTWWQESEWGLWLPLSLQMESYLCCSSLLPSWLWVFCGKLMPWAGNWANREPITGIIWRAVCHSEGYGRANTIPGHGTRGEDIISGCWKKQQTRVQGTVDKYTERSWTILLSITIPNEESKALRRLSIMDSPREDPTSRRIGPGWSSYLLGQWKQYPKQQPQHETSS